MKIQIFNKVKRILALTLSATLAMQMMTVYASEESAGHRGKEKQSGYAAEDLETLVYSDETTEEILELVRQGLKLKTFFAGDLTKGTTEEDLMQWQSEGKNIQDIIREKAVSLTDTIQYENNDADENNAMERLLIGDIPIAAATPSNGKYYLTQVENYFDGCAVNLDGTGYAGELFNPKTNGTGSSEPWYISLGGEQAMCCTYMGHASIRTDHNYIESSINNLRNNLYFKGGNTYPVEAYFRGAAYAYETLTYPDNYISGAGQLNADMQELARKAGGELVYRSGKTINYAVFQIITWRIAQGSFNPADMDREKAIAKYIFGQMYPPGDWNDTYYQCIESFYEYYAQCAKECASGRYNQKYKGVFVKYWQVQGADSNKWQDFITWKVDTDIPVKIEFVVNKIGKVFSGNKFSNASFYIYSDSGCTNKIGELATNTSGQAVIDKIVEGVYYLKEVKAPTGTIKNNAAITLIVDDTVDSINVSNEEYYNGIVFCKYDTATSEVITLPGTFALYEYVNGNYLKVCNFTFRETGFTTSAGVTIPDYSYLLTSDTTQTYHNSNGTVAKTITSSDIYYTPVNQGKFKIVEETAPSGYKVNTSEKNFTMNLNTQGYLNNFTSIAMGISDNACSAGVQLTKYDTLSAGKLSGADFKIQEKIRDTWYDVGNLVYDSVNEVYKTSVTQTYILRNSSGSVCISKTNTEYPLRRTSANKGKYRIVETKLPNENYVNAVVKTFTVTPTEDNHLYQFSTYNGGMGNAVFNTGKSISVKTAKYDFITKEQLASSNVATMTVYEYNNHTKEWQSLGNLVYNSTTDEYVLDSEAFYTPHTEDGSLSTASVGAVYNQGYIYYTSVNQGQFKIVETVNPVNYLLGTFDTATSSVKVYEKTFTINERMTDGEVIDFTDMNNAAYDTGVSANIHVTKNDMLTSDKVESGNAEFTVYENVNENWLEVGKLVYDNTAKTYKSVGMTAIYHNSAGTEVFKTVITDKAGLTYTTANTGKFKVTETKAPSYYQNSGFEKEFTIDESVKGDTIRFDSYATGAKDLGIRGTVSVEKYDIVTQELAKAFNAEFTVYEKVNDKWLETGKLKYDEKENRYTGNGVAFIFHKADGTIIDTSNIAGYEQGKLYYTTANKGKFKVVETKAPLNYTIGSFSREFTLKIDGQANDYIRFVHAAQNFGIHAILNVQKYDVMTQGLVDKKDAEFTIQEYVTGLNQWMDVTKLKYDEKAGVYSTKNQTSVNHNNAGEVIYTNTAGRLYYTTQNLGRYRVIETKPPTYYTNGSMQYIKEFNILDKNSSGIIDLTSYADSAKNLGFRGTVSVAKYDNLTREKVQTSDTEFTVCENVGNKWLEVGKLAYDKSTKTYVSDNTTFTFHKEDGSNINVKDLQDYVSGRLYYTSANKGRFKVAETKAPEHYMMENLLYAETKIFEEEFIINTDNQKVSYNSYDTGARNNGEYTFVELKKYDTITKQSIELTDAIFAVQEFVGDEWLDVCSLKFHHETGHYVSKGMKITLHDSEKNEIYSDNSGRLYYTTANDGNFRIVEAKAPTYYTIGSEPYVYEFNVTDKKNDNVTELTELIYAPQDLGVYGLVEVAKYDSITKEKVKTGDAEFTIYEQVKDVITGLTDWLEIGKLVYDKESRNYICEGVNFTFHDSEGNILDTSGIKDYETGRLYYTTVNKGNFKVAETSSPENYILEEYSIEFNICNNTYEDSVQKSGLDNSSVTVSEQENGVTLSNITAENSVSGMRFLAYTDIDTNAAQNKGITGNLELMKTDRETDKPLEGAVFALQEWSVKADDWLFIGNLADAGNGLYTSKETSFNYHTDILSDEGSEMTEKQDGLVYTSQNLGKFRIVEIKAPKGYLNDNYAYELQLSENQTFFDLTDSESRATDAPIKVGLSKKSITTGKDITGASLIVKDMEGNVIDSWVSNGMEHLISGIKPGKYVFIEETAPEGYVIANSVKFEVTEIYEIQKVEMFDEVVQGKVIIHKTDKDTGKNLVGAKFELKSEDGTFSQILVTDENGYAESDLLHFGIYDSNGAYLGSKMYTLTEISAPEGYELNRTPKIITFAYQDDKMKVVELKLDITNTKIPPVKTGDSSSGTMIMFLALLVAMTLCAELCLKKEKMLI